MPGKKTHEQILRTLERKPDIPDARWTEASLQEAGKMRGPRHSDRRVRQNEFPLSRGGMHQENPDHDPGQGGHRPLQPSPEQEKQ